MKRKRKRTDMALVCLSLLEGTRDAVETAIDRAKDDLPWVAPKDNRMRQWESSRNTVRDAPDVAVAAG